MFFPLAMLSQYFFGPALFLISLFIVLIILLQRGRGGGLTGALGGAGGASAFGVKAGDIFTRITAVAVLLWIVLCVITCFWYLPPKLNISSTPSSTSSNKLGSDADGVGGMGGLEPSSAIDSGDEKTSEVKPDSSTKNPEPITLPQGNVGSTDNPALGIEPPKSEAPDAGKVPDNTEPKP